MFGKFLNNSLSTCRIKGFCWILETDRLCHLKGKNAKLVIETGKSTTSFAGEMGNDTNTVCRWVRDYRRKHKLPSYAGIKPLHPISEGELIRKSKEMESTLKKQEKLLADEKEKVEILKKIPAP
jgi:transposase-like protein